MRLQSSECVDLVQSKSWWRAALAAAVLVVLLAACGSTGTSARSSATTGPTGPFKSAVENKAV